VIGREIKIRPFYRIIEQKVAALNAANVYRSFEPTATESSLVLIAKEFGVVVNDKEYEVVRDGDRQIYR